MTQSKPPQRVYFVEVGDGQKGVVCSKCGLSPGELMDNRPGPTWCKECRKAKKELLKIKKGSR